MDETFRLRNAILYLAITGGVLSLAMIAVCTSIFFLENPKEHGFNGEHSVLLVGGMGLTVCGVILLLSLYLLAAYFVERFSICGTTLTLQTVLRNHRFDVSDLDRLFWKRHGDGRIVFRCQHEKPYLDLHGYSAENRLRVISALRDLVPHDRQEGWPEFCHHVALRLRGFLKAQTQRELMPGQLRITRSRYDRMAVIAVPSSAILAVAVGLGTGRWQFLALPALLIGFWVLLRSTVPTTGRVERRLMATPSGRAFTFYYLMFLIPPITGAALSLWGVEKSIVRAIMLAGAVISAVPVLHLCYKEDKNRRLADAYGVQTAPERWLEGVNETSDGT
ncbi:MAG: hypothetical protein KF777_23035 [Planctomycetaceae bacterium]|nr:hypothetical protein [Planctomycetaceae bacterium]